MKSIFEIRNIYQRTWEKVMKYCEDCSVKNKNWTEARKIFKLFEEEINARDREIEELFYIINDK